MTESKTLYPQTAMLNEVMQILVDDPAIESEEQAFDALLHFIAYAVEYEVMIQTPWIQLKTMDALKEKLDLDLLRQDTWDWLGEIYELRVGKKDYLVSRKEVTDFAKEYPIKNVYPDIPAVFDQATGSGRLILALAANINNEFPVIYYASEPDVTGYRMTLLNCKLYGINARVLCVNYDAYDVRPFSPNWKFADQWKPVAEKKLFTEEQVNDMKIVPMKEPASVYYY